jgi:putative addiction module killer protein
MIEIQKTELFVKWLDKLHDIRARARILVRIKRLTDGNPGDVKPVGEGVSELRIMDPATEFITSSSENL